MKENLEFRRFENSDFKHNCDQCSCSIVIIMYHYRILSQFKKYDLTFDVYGLLTIRRTLNMKSGMLLRSCNYESLAVNLKEWEI